MCFYLNHGEFLCSTSLLGFGIIDGHLCSTTTLLTEPSNPGKAVKATYSFNYLYVVSEG